MTVRVINPANREGDITVSVALSPRMGVYTALYQASLELATGSGINPLDFRVKKSRGRNCYVIAEVSGTRPELDFAWHIEVTDRTGQVREFSFVSPQLAKRVRVPFKHKTFSKLCKSESRRFLG